MTKRDFYAKVIAAAIDEELTEFAKAEIEKLDKENAKRREKTAAKAAEGEEKAEKKTAAKKTAKKAE